MSASSHVLARTLYADRIDQRRPSLSRSSSSGTTTSPARSRMTAVPLSWTDKTSGCFMQIQWVIYNIDIYRLHLLLTLSDLYLVSQSPLSQSRISPLLPPEPLNPLPTLLDSYSILVRFNHKFHEVLLVLPFVRGTEDELLTRLHDFPRGLDSCS